MDFWNNVSIKLVFLKNSQKSMQKLFLRAEKRVEKVVSIKVSNLILFGNGHPVCFAQSPLGQTSRYPCKGSSWVFSNWVRHKVGRTHLALQNAWVYSKLGRSKCFSNYLNFRAKNISKYKLLHSRVDPTSQKVYRS